jgi:hypothetical protein
MPFLAKRTLKPVLEVLLFLDELLAEGRANKTHYRRKLPESTITLLGILFLPEVVCLDESYSRFFPVSH